MIVFFSSCRKMFHKHVSISYPLFFFVQYLINQSMKKTKTEEKKANIHLVSIQNLVSEQLFVRTQ